MTLEIAIALIGLLWLALIALMLAFFAGAARGFRSDAGGKPHGDLSNSFHTCSVMRWFDKPHCNN